MFVVGFLGRRRYRLFHNSLVLEQFFSFLLNWILFWGPIGGGIINGKNNEKTGPKKKQLHMAIGKELTGQK